MTHCLVVDTNVFAVAADLHGGASDECKLACIQILRTIEGGHRIAVDHADAIFTEYLGALRACPQPTFASKLAIRLYRLRHSQDVCHQIEITPVDAPPGSFAEVPPVLQDFDTDDQKFIAVAAAEGNTPPLIAGIDGEWWDRRVDFADAKLDLQFPCMADLV
jgi:hypothetical protein